MINAYAEGKKAFDKGDYLFASKKFNEVEILYPQSIWAPKSILMSSYSYYLGNYYSDAIFELNRFIKTYPQHSNIDYAYFLLATCYYETIVDEKKDLKPLVEARKLFSLIIKEYPNTDFAMDSQFKVNLIEDILASKEIYIARLYQDKEKWIPAINRYQIILENYSQTIYVEEAMHRLVEIYFLIGLEDESKKYAKLLGYNYQSSKWYKESYKIFNKNYKPKNKKYKKNKKNKNNFISDKFKKIFS
jgi:outer membrane protein assembly factor BamD